MENLKKVISLVAVSAVLFVFYAQAQDVKANAVKKQPKGLEKNISNLTDEQKAQLKANQEEAKKVQEAFRASLSDEQKAIFDNKDLNPQERRAALAKALTAEQKEAMKNNAMARKEMAEKFSKTLTEEQKAQMKEMAERRKQNPRLKSKGKE